MKVFQSHTELTGVSSAGRGAGAGAESKPAQTVFEVHMGPSSLRGQTLQYLDPLDVIHAGHSNSTDSQYTPARAAWP